MIKQPGAPRRVALAELVHCAGPHVVGRPDDGEPSAVEVVDVVHDSRRVTAGSLFVCLRGSSSDGHDHAAAAVASGATALVTERPLGLGVPEITVDDARRAMAPIAACVFGHPAESLTVVGVTGTNGKTTVVHLLASIFGAAGIPAATIGTLTGGYSTPTTPEAPELHRRLAEHVANGVKAVAIEVSSHALALHRADALTVDVAVFTNLGRDHLDFHESMDSYFQAKARLFTPEHARAAVVNLDDPYGRLLHDAATVPTTGYSFADAADLELTTDHSRFRWQGHEVRLPLVGRVNVANALAAATAARHLGIAPDAVVAGLAAVEPVRGRFERVPIDAPFDAMVDFAHTPDALGHLLDTARELVGGGAVHLVVGCGGDKDRGKRAPMGEVAARLADRVVLTSDNPRGEDPDAIIAEMRAGIDDPAGVEVEVDRRRAIARALAAAGPGDLVVVAGKGHETEQVTGDLVVPFDDRQVVIEEWARRAGAST